jgi:hypothetical protein
LVSWEERTMRFRIAIEFQLWTLRLSLELGRR